MQKNAWYKLILMPLMISFAPQSLRRPGAAWGHRVRFPMGT